jgi:hypothetical protein
VGSGNLVFASALQQLHVPARTPPNMTPRYECDLHCEPNCDFFSRRKPGVSHHLEDVAEISHVENLVDAL